MFLSHAAADAPLVRVIRDEIDRTFARGIDVFASSVPGQVAPGGDWLNNINTRLAQSKAVIVLSTPASLERPWIWFEVGASWSRMERAKGKVRILPVCVPEVDTASLPEPLCRLQAMSLGNPVETRLLFQELIDLFGFGTLEHFRYATIKENLPRYPALPGSAVRSPLGSDAGLATDAPASSAVRQVPPRGIAASQQAGQGWPRSSSTNSTLTDELAEITRLYEILSATGPFGDLVTPWAVDHIVGDARARLAHVVAAEQLSVEHRAHVQGFWTDAVFGRARTSVWTTNVGKPGDNLGGSDDSHLLAIQASAQQHGLVITRLFVYDAAMDPSEAEIRRQIMHNQSRVHQRAGHEPGRVPGVGVGWQHRAPNRFR